MFGVMERTFSAFESSYAGSDWSVQMLAKRFDAQIENFVNHQVRCLSGDICY